MILFAEMLECRKNVFSKPLEKNDFSRAATMSGGGSWSSLCFRIYSSKNENPRDKTRKTRCVRLRKEKDKHKHLPYTVYSLARDIT